MDQLIVLVSDLCVMIFDLLLYMQMTVLRENKARNKRIVQLGCTLIIAFYFAAVYLLKFPVALSVVVCMTLPSLGLFWAVSQYRDARFFLTFCFVDTVSVAFGFIARYVGVMLGDVGPIVSILLTALPLALIYRLGRPYFERYREALEFIDRGWLTLTCSAALIYITLIFVAAYPEPLINRPKSQFSYLLICLMVLSFYTVFLTSILMTLRVYKQSVRLKEQQKWFKLAYVDGLTEVPNRMAFIEKVHQLERCKEQHPLIAMMFMDLDAFKDINDTWGHSAGDRVLRQAAQDLSTCFPDEGCTVYRTGGDEFAVIAVGLPEEEIKARLARLQQSLGGDIAYSISAGYSFVEPSQDNALDRAFERADAMMYQVKSQKAKLSAQA